MPRVSSIYDVQYTTLIDACTSGDADAAQRELLANPEWLNALMESTENKRTRQAMWGRSVAFLACITIAIIICVVLIPHGSSRDVLTAVFIAVVALLAAVAMLIRLRRSYILIKGTRAGTPLHHAIRSDQMSVILVLLSLHPDLSLRDYYGQTALEAAQSRGAQTIQALIIDEAAWQDRPPEYACDQAPPVRRYSSC